MTAHLSPSPKKSGPSLWLRAADRTGVSSSSLRPSPGKTRCVGLSTLKVAICRIPCLCGRMDDRSTRFLRWSMTSSSVSTMYLAARITSPTRTFRHSSFKHLTLLRLHSPLFHLSATRSLEHLLCVHCLYNCLHYA